MITVWLLVVFLQNGGETVELTVGGYETRAECEKVIRSALPESRKYLTCIGQNVLLTHAKKPFRMENWF